MLTANGDEHVVLVDKVTISGIGTSFINLHIVRSSSFTTYYVAFVRLRIRQGPSTTLNKNDWNKRILFKEIV